MLKKFEDVIYNTGHNNADILFPTSHLRSRTFSNQSLVNIQFIIQSYTFTESIIDLNNFLSVEYVFITIFIMYKMYTL